MKKALCILLLAFFLFSVSFAQAAEWKTVRFPNEPNYIFMLPDSCYTIYYGMPDDSPILQDLGMTAEYAELYLKTYDASIIIYPKNLSCTITIGRFIDDVGNDFNDTDIKELRILAKQMGEKLEEYYNSSTSSINYTFYPKDSGTYETDYAKYIILTFLEKTATKEIMLTQVMTVVNGYQTMLYFATEENEYVEDNLNMLFDILNNLVII